MFTQKSNINRNKKVGREAYSEKKILRYVGLPINKQTMSVELTGTKLSFEGTLDGYVYHTINNFDGKKFEIDSKAVQEVSTPADSLDPSFAIVPIKDTQLFTGLIMVRPVMNAPQQEDRTIEFYFE